MCAAHAMMIGWRPRLNPAVLYIAGASLIAWLIVSPRILDLGVVGSAIRATTNEWLMVLCVLLVVAVAGRDLRGGYSLLRSKPLVKLGEWSCTFYLVHATSA